MAPLLTRYYYKVHTHTAIYVYWHISISIPRLEKYVISNLLLI
jgi:hypothetical protein